MNISFPIKRPEALKDWVSSVPPEIVEKGKKLLKDAKEGGRCTGTANFIGVGENKAEHYHCASCHARMAIITPPCRTVLATENGQDRSRATGTEMFLEWLLNHSPYHFIILNRDDPEFCAKYGFILAGDAPTTYVQSVCIMTRHFYERPKCFKPFNDMVLRGIDPLIAYNIAFNSTMYNYGPEAYKATLFLGMSGHTVHPAFNPEVLCDIVRGNLKGELGKTYQEAPSIYGTCALFYNKLNPSIYYSHKDFTLCMYRENSAEFHDFLLENEGKKGVENVYRPPNPFNPHAQREKVSAYSFTLAQAVGPVADYCQQFMEKELSKDV